MPFRPTAENISHIRLMFQLGRAVEDIAIHFNCTIKCIKKWQSRLAEEAAGGEIALDRRKYNSSAARISNGQLELITNYMGEHPFTPVKHLVPVLNLPVRYNTLRSAIKKTDRFTISSTC